jgi:hypothetical protein
MKKFTLNHQEVRRGGVVAANVIGGSGGVQADTVNGAEVTGTFAVTPGEVLTIGVGGRGGDAYNNVMGGWGLPYDGSSFSGNNGLNPNSGNAGGGGASVILAPNNQVVAVAGGAGGQGIEATGNNSVNYGLGGQGGYDGNLIGQDGQPTPMGGKAGAAGSTQGQSDTSGGDQIPGAGGGGYQGGDTGVSGTGGGGAGSSYDQG